MARHQDRSPDEITLAITTADHRIGDAPRFAETVVLALEAAERHDSLVTCGIRPAYPETGFGYIETDDDSPILLEKDEGLNVCRARAFHEKPTLERAKEFFASGRHLWNSGMFFWKLSVFLQELQKARPVMATLVQDLTKALLAGNQALAADIFEQMENISIDFALMEKSDRVLVVSGSFPWADVGSWNAIATPDKTDDHGNYVVGNPIVVECNNCVVYNDAASPKMAVGVAGMTNTVVVVTEDAVLVLPKDRAQEVRAIVDELKRRNAEQL
jgi:mannose-1-phosphate guanylyltransferase